MKHTPGNWKVGNHGSVVTNIIRNHNDAIDSYHEDAIAFYGGELICESIQIESDAHLIAAAPELLEALEDLWQFVLDNSGDDCGCVMADYSVGIYPSGPCSHCKTKAAIAKAKGES